MESNSKYYFPAEWEAHNSVCLAWPHLKNEWGPYYEGAEREFVDLVNNIALQDNKLNETVHVLVNNDETFQKAQRAFKNEAILIHNIPYGDIWLRDTGSIWTWDMENKTPQAQAFIFNGWGNKYLYESDPELSQSLPKHLKYSFKKWNWVLEGGSLDVNGKGICLTTEQCLLNPNRNPGLNRQQIEALLKESLGLNKIIWLKDGLENDHTDGHIDTLARFSSENEVLCMVPKEKDDPNTVSLLKIRDDLKNAGFKVREVPSPGKVYNDEDQLLPASYMNFYISNKAVIVPVYGSVWDNEAVHEISKAFPERKTIGLMAKSILSGGGAFHCITQQIPDFSRIL